MTDDSPRIIAEKDLAGRGARLGAAAVDSLIVGVIAIPIGLVFLGDDFMAANIAKDTVLIYTFIWLAVYGLLNGHFLAKQGQTIGKRIVGVRIVCGGDRIVFARENAQALPSAQTGAVPPLWKSFGLRYAVFTIFFAVMQAAEEFGIFFLFWWFLAMANYLLIFRDKRQCGHDILAGTVVVKADHQVNAAPSAE